MVEDPVTKRHQPRNYLDILETRVAYLEGLLHSTGQKPTETDNIVVPNRPAADPLTPCTTATPTVLSFSSPSHTPQPDTSKSRHDKSDDDVDSLAANVGMLGLCATGMEPRYLGSSSAFAFSRAISTSLLLRDTSPAAGREGMNGVNETGRLPCALPSYEEGLVLSNAYFENIHIQYPFLHEPTFRMWEVQRVSSLPVPVSDPEVASFFVYLVSCPICTTISPRMRTRPLAHPCPSMIYPCLDLRYWCFASSLYSTQSRGTYRNDDMLRYLPC